MERRKATVFLPAVLHPSPSVTRKPDLLTVRRPALPSPITSGLLTTEDAAAFAAAVVDLLGSTNDESRAILLRPDGVHDRRAQHDDAESTSALLQHNTALQKERNAEHFSGALGADQGVLRAAEEIVGANLKVAKQVRVRVHDSDHRGTILGTTCLNDTERRRRHDCVFDYVLCHPVHTTLASS
ncbi:hypothetical protein EDB89DRAFT_2230336 [Lactarius sanguifluus]|nr:hypothetical protein EDB89DRAFT_2230336 [Lactarius sanguifluus]